VYLIVRIVENGDDDTLAHADGDDLDDGADLTVLLEFGDLTFASDEPERKSNLRFHLK
jgi:hypothetical protein